MQINIDMDPIDGVDFLSKPDDRFVTPDSLAWDLIMGDDMEDYSAIMQKFVPSDSASNIADLYEQMADEFQILITIYMEMVFTVLKSNYMGGLLDEDGDVRDGIDLEEELSKYRPDFMLYDVSDMTNIFRSKFLKIRYFLSVQDITDRCTVDPSDFGMSSEYYCKTLLMDDGRSTTKSYFERASHIPDDKRYTFLIRADSKHKQKKLSDFYTVMYLPPYKNGKNRKIKLSFEKFNVNSNPNPHYAD